MINYIENGSRMHTALNAEGMSIRAVGDGTVFANFSAFSDAEINLFILNYDPLPEAKADAKNRIIREAARRVHAIYPFIDPDKADVIGFVDFMTDMYLSIKPAAREPLTGRMLEVKNIRDGVVVTRASINAMTDWQAVDAYDATGW